MTGSRRDFLKSTGLFALLAGTTGVLNSNVFSQTTGKSTDKPNIVFLLSDDHSVPDMGCYGNRAVTTPNLDNLARQGMRFNKCYVACPQCSPSRASILTGRPPHTTGASKLHAPALPEFIDIIELFKKANYYTAAYRKVHQDLIQKKFDAYYNDNEPLTTFFSNRPKNKPFFLWFGSREPHRPYGPGKFSPPHKPEDVIVPNYLPDTPKVRQDLAYYYDGIAKFDKDCGQILDLLQKNGLFNNTIVVVSGDNGLPFPRAKASLYEAGVNVPLLIRWPGRVMANTVSNELVSFYDFPATWLELAGIKIPETFEGISLVPYLTGQTNYIPRDYAFIERNWHDTWVPMRGLVTDNYKLIINYRTERGYTPSLDLYESDSFQEIMRLGKSGELSGNLEWYLNKKTPLFELYDLKKDPGEWNNVADNPSYKTIRDELLEAVSKWMFETNDFLPPIIGSFPADYPQYAGLIPIDAGINWP